MATTTLFVDSQPAYKQCGPLSNPLLSPAKRKAKSTTGQLRAKRCILKPKQSKSRAGCATCKAKRLKCDETKPTCQQCARRNIVCGGYAKTYRWRQFEETTYGTKPLEQEDDEKREHASPYVPNAPLPWRPHRQHGNTSLAPAVSASTETRDLGSLFLQPSVPYSDFSCIKDQSLDIQDLTNSLASTTHNFNGLGYCYSSFVLPFDSFLQTSNFTQEAFFGGSDFGWPLASQECMANVEPEEQPMPVNLECNTGPLGFREKSTAAELGRRPLGASENHSWELRSLQSNSTLTLFRPAQTTSSNAILLHRWHSTCSILSVRDGANENPWRTIVWPLAVESPALFHAISSMTAFHSARRLPQLKIDGIEHMRKSIRYLASNINHMPVKIALATALVLSFTESWDYHFVSTGLYHMNAARVLVRKVLARGGTQVLDNRSLKFFCNSLTYMDVIARLTAEVDDVDVAFWSLAEPKASREEIDPLMGCASTLFPLIGQVADLVSKVKKTTSTSTVLVSRATELRAALEAWRLPLFVHSPEDPTCDVRHSLSTAEAYRWATLLYLGQAVPETVPEGVTRLANRVLGLLAGIPQTSRTMILHIFPLLVAGCEAESHEDREFVERRWTAMSNMMLICNVDRCHQVTKEVWARRSESQPSGVMHGSTDFGNASLPSLPKVPEGLPFERTVRGNSHWVQVLQDFGWEVFLG